MALEIFVAFDRDDANRVNRKLKSLTQSARIVSQSTNKTIRHGKAVVKRHVVSKLNLRPGYVAKFLTARMSSPTDQIGWITIRSTGVPWLDYIGGTKAVTRGSYSANGKGQKRQPVVVTMRRGKRETHYERTFIARVQNPENQNAAYLDRHKGVYRRARVSNGRLPIHALFGPGPASVYVATGDKPTKDLHDYRAKEIDRLVNLALSRG